MGIINNIKQSNGLIGFHQDLALLTTSLWHRLLPCIRCLLMIFEELRWASEFCLCYILYIYIYMYTNICIYVCVYVLHYLAFSSPSNSHHQNHCICLWQGNPKLNPNLPTLLGGGESQYTIEILHMFSSWYITVRESLTMKFTVSFVFGVLIKQTVAFGLVFVGGVGWQFPGACRCMQRLRKQLVMLMILKSCFRLIITTGVNM